MVDKETSKLPINSKQNTNGMVEKSTHIIINAAHKSIGCHTKLNIKPRAPW
jgi:hypothetical protein